MLLLGRFSRVWLCATPPTAAHQAPPSKQEHRSGLAFLSPMYENEKWKWSLSVVSDSLWPYGLQPTRLLRPWNFPGKSTGVGCHAFSTGSLEHYWKTKTFKLIAIFWNLLPWLIYTWIITCEGKYKSLGFNRTLFRWARTANTISYFCLSNS